MKVYLTTLMHFSAAHRLSNPAFTEKQNYAVFGSCSNPSGHGHNYKLLVTVVGEPDPVTGMVIDLHKLKNIISTSLVNLVDHKHLNVDVEFLHNINPTAENLVIAFWKILKKELKDLLHEIILYETDKQWVTYRGR